MRQFYYEIYFFGLSMLFGTCFFSCKQQPDHSTEKHQLKIEVAKGYVVPKDSIRPPKILPASNPKIVLVQQQKTVPFRPNLKITLEPKVVLAGQPTLCTPGVGGFSRPKIVPALHHPVLAGLPNVSPANEVSSIDPNPQNFSSFNKLQGLSKGTNVQSILEDKSGNLWLGTTGGALKYDGKNFTNFTKNQGLSNNIVSCLFEDKSGNLWFGTWGGGVTKYDGQNFTSFSSKEGLSSNYVFSINGDRNGNIWIGTLNGGVSKYDGKNFTYFTTKEGLGFNSVLSIIQDGKGNLWMGTDGGGVSKYDGKSFSNFTVKEGLSHNIVTCISEDKTGNLWFGTQGGGISKFDGQNFMHFTQKEGLPNDFVLSIIEDKTGSIWFSNWGGGVSKYDGQNFTHFTVLKGLPSSNIQSILEDKSGNMWFGTNGDGISRYNNQKVTKLTKKEGLDYNVTSITEDKSGKLWFGTYGGGILQYDGQSFTKFGKKGSSYSSLVTSMITDHSGNLWFGTWDGGLFKYDGSFFTQFTVKEGLSINRVTSIIEDKIGNLWIGTDFGGVSKYDGKTFTTYTTNEGLGHNVISCIAEDKNGNLWFGTTGGGVTRYNGKNFMHFTEKQNFSNDILSILVDKNGNLWFGTLGLGVIKYDGKTFTYFTEKDGLMSNSVMSILEDKSGNLWFGTDAGLSKLTKAKQAEISEKTKRGIVIENNAFFINYTAEDGFKEAGKSIFEAKNGAIWVGTGDNLTVFQPKELMSDTTSPSLQLTNLAIFNENIAWADLSHKKDISVKLENGVKLADFQFKSVSKWYNVPKGLSLAYNNNYLSFHFTGITLQSPSLVKYQHQLEGLEDNWNALSSQNNATYGNLLPGTYTFKVKAFSKEGVRSKELRYTFSIRPPWWQTWWAYICYVLLLGGTVYAFYQYKIKQRLQQAEALRLKELDEVKTRLYTNITHEFRTPLTVILGMAQQVLNDPQLYLREGISMIIRNGQNLLSLVNQMLDLSKLESGKLVLHYQRADIVYFIRYIVESFHSLAQNKGVQLHFIPVSEPIITDFDEVRLQQIVSNLLSNAIKFTPKGGHVYVSSYINNDKVVLKIKDTGIGITEADLPLIFDRFYQSDGTHTRQGEGTGIGLALTRELVKIMEGTIAAKNNKDKGAEFEVVFPLLKILNFEETVQKTTPSETIINEEVPVPISDKLDADALTFFGKQLNTKTSSKSNRAYLLIADDNEDVRAYLAACLNNDYVIEVAKNGQECEDLAFNTTPDLIVLDVMMPFKDGFEVCKTLKSDERTSHIPIIMLTAKADMDSRLEGLEQGADDYLTKPFHKKELLLRVRNLLGLRRQLQQYYRSTLDISLKLDNAPIAKNALSPSNSILKNVENGSKSPSNPLPDSLENAFVIKVRKAIEDNLDSTDFDVEKLCRHLALSHSQVHRKLSALTGLSATHFIRYIRLVKAKEMIKSSGYKIAAIAMDCGFDDPAYFSRVFKQEFGITPQGWREQNSN
jgi:signal transduction histidine kinase/ligand-binding sensor domain-containing protein/AraC-like DNA-binding protein/DNA-binding NarL/FixJ family response regulator